MRFSPRQFSIFLLLTLGVALPSFAADPEWLWSNGDPKETETVYFRKTFELKGKPKAAVFAAFLRVFTIGFSAPGGHLGQRHPDRGLCPLGHDGGGRRHHGRVAPACRQLLVGHRRHPSERHRRGLRASFSGPIRLSFNHGSHAFVAFSNANFRGKPPGQSAPDHVEFVPPEDRLRKYGKRPV